MTKSADRRGGSRGISLAGLVIGALALVGCEQPAAPAGRLPEADVPGPSEAWKEAADKFAARPEVDRVSFARNGEPIAVFFRRNQVANDDLAALAELPTLRWLDLVDTGITDAGLSYLAKLPKLETLYLNNIQVGDDGVAQLAGLQELKMLHLGRTRVTNAALASITKLNKLQELHLERTKIDDAGLKSIESLPDLQELYLTGSAVTPEGVARLKEALPKLVVYFLSKAEDPIED